MKSVEKKKDEDNYWCQKRGTYLDDAWHSLDADCLRPDRDHAPRGIGFELDDDVADGYQVSVNGGGDVHRKDIDIGTEEECLFRLHCEVSIVRALERQRAFDRDAVNGDCHVDSLAFEEVGDVFEVRDVGEAGATALPDDSRGALRQRNGEDEDDYWWPFRHVRSVGSFSRVMRYIGR